MGYIGLLLNAPYKIDSMVWMMLMMMVFCFRSWCLFSTILLGLYEPGVKGGRKDLNGGGQGFRRF
jgi:hypothetical protein